jgi:hypothetical protein
MHKIHYGCLEMNPDLRSSIIIAAMLGATLLTACGAPLAQEPSSTSIPALANAIAATDTPAPTVDATATQNAQQTAAALATANTEMTRIAQKTRAVQASATARRIAEATAKAGPRATYDAGTMLTRTARAISQTAEAANVQASATAQKVIFTSVIEKLWEDGIVNAIEGDYYRLDDFDQSWAQINWYQWWRLNHLAENFVLSTDVSWQSASDTANWYASGCGFVFSETDRDHHHVAYLTLDGYGVLARLAKGDWKTLAAQRYGKVSTPNGNAKIMLVVDDKRINFYVNDKLVTNAYDNSIKEGNIAFTLLSGTNKDFGTRCKMSNIELFILK